MPKDLQLTAIIADRLVKLRRMTGLTQDAVANAIGIGRTNYSHYENQKATPPMDKIVRLAAVFGVTTDFLLGREQTMAPSALHDSPFPTFDDMTEQLSRLKEDELILVLQYRQLSPEQKKELFSLTSDFLEKDSE